MNNFKFIDLFAGIGGFHQAMKNLGGECVYASEIDKYAIETYKKNYNIDSAHNVKEINKNTLLCYDVLCAGFPCQTFSKAGLRKGFEDETKGTLFFEVKRILSETRPKYFILENVKNLLTHDKGNTMEVIKKSLEEIGYNYSIVLLSPHEIGIPQLRERIYILGVDNKEYSKPLIFNKSDNIKYNISSILEDNVDSKYNIDEHKEKVLTCLNEFYKGIKEKVIGFPVWMEEFKNTYELKDLPKWKTNFCTKNRELYKNNKEFIDKWLDKWNNLKDFTPTEKKLEWQAGNSIDSIWDGIIQFRPSGIRVKRPDYFPALVAIGQVPVIGKLKRRLTPRECARLQSFPDDFILNENDHQAYKQFGNSVNVKCIEYLARQLFEQVGK